MTEALHKGSQGGGAKDLIKALVEVREGGEKEEEGEGQVRQLSEQKGGRQESGRDGMIRVYWSAGVSLLFVRRYSLAQLAKPLCVMCVVCPLAVGAVA